jgi:hypothetical protein
LDKLTSAVRASNSLVSITMGFILNDTDGTTPYEAASYMISITLYVIQVQEH